MTAVQALHSLTILILLRGLPVSSFVLTDSAFVAYVAPFLDDFNLPTFVATTLDSGNY